MPRARRVAIVLTAAVLAAPASALAQSGGAGDNQYQDPFGGSSGSSSKPTPHKSSSSGSSNGLSQSSGLSSGSTTSPATSSPTTVPTSPASATSSTSQLPNTGSDPRLIILAGLALLLSGIGLRLRTADEIF
jgi:LPXTG-motif cell wall-anchored protein